MIAKKKGRLLLITQNVIDNVNFNIWGATTWKYSIIREKLKEIFATAFDAREKNMILRSKIVTSTIPYDCEADAETITSTDRLFLLSTEELRKYFEDDRSRKSVSTPYAESRGALNTEDQHAAGWWTRSMGWNESYAADVFPDGRICDGGEEVYEEGGVRPAMWIKVP